MIVVECSTCLRKFKVDDKHAGRLAECMCGHLIPVWPSQVKAAQGERITDPPEAWMIVVECGGCMKRFEVDESYGGEIVRCICGKPLRVPIAFDSPAAQNLVRVDNATFPDPVLQQANRDKADAIAIATAKMEIHGQWLQVIGSALVLLSMILVIYMGVKLYLNWDYIFDL